MPSDHSDERSASEESRPDVTALASTVISVLSDKGGNATLSIRASVVQRLVDSALHPAHFEAEKVLQEIKSRRISEDQIVDVYIPEAAKELGQMWVEDAISFAKVTIGTARLQGLLILLSKPWYPASAEASTNMLLVLQSDDNHTLGPHVAIAQLRRLGVSVRIAYGSATDEILHMLSEESYDTILFSGSRAESLASIEKMVKRIRTRVLAPPPMVLGGLVVSLIDGVKEKTKVDLVTNDVKVALKLCEKKKSITRLLAR